MRFSTSIVFFVIITVMSTQLFAQESFDRLHQLGQNISMLSQDVLEQENGSFVMFSTVDTLDVENLNLTSANLSIFDPKGNFDRSIDYYFRDTISLEPDGQIEITEEGFLMSAISDADTMFNIIVVSMDRGRNPIWSQTYGSGLEIAQEANHQAEIVNLADSVYVVLATIQGVGNQELGMMSLDPENGDVVIFNSLQPEDAGITVNALDHNMTLSSDTTRVIVAGNYANGESAYLLEVDATTGNIIWSRSYTPEDTGANGISLTDIIVAQDSSILVTGTVDDQALVARFDFEGNYIWGFELTEPLNTDGLSLDITEGGFIRVGGGQVTGEANIYTPFQITLTPDGNPISQAQFPLFSGSYLVDAQIEGTMDNGSIFVGAGIEIDSSSVSALVPREIRPRLIKTNDMDVTTCEEDFMMTLDSSLFVIDTLIWQSTAISDGADTIETTVAGTSPITTPILSLQDTTFCPGDPVEFLIDATTEGAVSYIWFDAETPTDILSTDSTFLATELDIQYVAVVEVFDEFCYILCDTTTLTDLDPPTVELLLLNDRFCSEGTFEIVAQVMGSSIQSVEWSTGDQNVSSVRVSEFGNYSVTVTNTCDDSDSANIQISESDLPEALVPNLGRSNPCDTPGSIDLFITNAGNFSNIVWNTGETGTSITVTDPGTFTFDALDTCGLAVTGSIVVGEGEIFTDPLEFNVNIGECDEENDLVELSLNITQGSANTIEWFSIDENNTSQSIASDVNTITQSSMGTYFVRLTNVCQTIDSPPITDPCQCIQFPNAFIPTVQTTRDFGNNDTFGPVNNCSEVLSYNLKVFNRFGQKVFESDAVADEWTGREGNNIDRAGVYVWVVNYETSNGEFSDRGSVTLLQ